MLRTVEILAATGTDEVIVGVSCGKDATATLALCCQHFRRVVGYFLYYVPELSFQERYLRFLERRFRVEIIRLPHFELLQMLANSTLRPHTKIATACKRITIKDIHGAVRERTGVEWIATGEKMIDSLQRRGMIHRCGGVDKQRKMIYPLASWNHAEVYSCLRRQKIPLPPDYDLFGRSFGGLRGHELKAIKTAYPEDYERILEVFPYADAAVKREELFRN